MTTPLSPLSPENALNLLKLAIDHEPDQLIQERVAARLEQSIAAGLVPIAASSTIAGQTATTASGHAATAAPGHAATAISGTTLGSLAASSKLMLGLTLAAGVGIGIGVDRWVMSESARSSVEARAAAGSSLLTTTAAPLLDRIAPTDTIPTVRAEDLPRLPAALQKRPPAELAPGQVTNVNAVDSAAASLRADPRDEQATLHQTSLREQQALLDQARLALGKGEPERCLAAIATHRSRFPQSLLAEERDALTIKALVASGSMSTASEQLETFLQDYPRSLLIPSLKSTVGNIQ